MIRPRRIAHLHMVAGRGMETTLGRPCHDIPPRECDDRARQDMHLIDAWVRDVRCVCGVRVCARVRIYGRLDGDLQAHYYSRP